MEQNSNRHVGIIGSGLIGKSWAMIFASAGHRVVLYDSDSNQLESALCSLKEDLRSYAEKRILRGSISAEEQINLIKGASDLSACLSNAKYVQECIPEQLPLKLKLFEAIDELIDDKAILASSTSTFLPSKLSQNLKHKSQFLVAHPVNPPYFVPLVEIVPAPWTSSWVVESANNLIKEVGQSPITLKREIDGFALNRIQYAILNECWNLFTDGILNVEDVDKTMSQGLGLRYAFLGPLEVAHLNAEGFANYSERYAESMYAVCQTFKPIPKLAGKPADEICKELCTRIPLEKLKEARAERDENLIKLSQLKNLQKQNR